MTVLGLNFRIAGSLSTRPVLEKSAVEFYTGKIARFSEKRYHISQFVRAMKAFKEVERHDAGAWQYNGQFTVNAGVIGIQADRLKKQAATTIATDWAGIEPQLDRKAQRYSSASKITTKAILAGLAVSCLSIDALSAAQSNILITAGMLITGTSMFAKGVFGALSSKYAGLKSRFATVSELATQEAH
jgi:hypothetical protein